MLISHFSALGSCPTGQRLPQVQPPELHQNCGRANFQPALTVCARLRWIPASGDLGVGRCRRYRVRAQWAACCSFCSAPMRLLGPPASRHRERRIAQGEKRTPQIRATRRGYSTPLSSVLALHPGTHPTACMRGVASMVPRAPTPAHDFRIAAVASARRQASASPIRPTPTTRKPATEISVEVAQSCARVYRIGLENVDPPREARASHSAGHRSLRGARAARGRAANCAAARARVAVQRFAKLTSAFYGAVSPQR